MTDKVIEAIENGDLTQENLTSSFLRKHYSQDFGSELWSQLGRGRNILENADELDQYLYSYGKMIIEQWNNYSSDYRYMKDNTTTVIDYGCGQGLATLKFIENWDILHKYVENIILIEPSKIALNRAEALLKCKYPNVNILSINKYLEDLSDDDLSYQENKIYIHIFSHLLDIDMRDDFNIFDFFDKITNNIGDHYIYILSHDREHNGGSDKILKIFNYISNNYLDKKILGGKYAKSIRLQRYKCYNNIDTIHLYCHIENVESLFQKLKV